LEGAASGVQAFSKRRQIEFPKIAVFVSNAVTPVNPYKNIDERMRQMAAYW
jgi:hypothetical protein